MLGMKAAAVTGGIGIVAVLVVFVALTIEKNAHADTKQKLADEQGITATIRSDYAKAAAERAKMVEASLREQQAELNRQLAQEEQLRSDLAKAEHRNRADRQNADTRIARLKDENEELRKWSAGPVPDDIIDWMLEPITDAAAATTP